MWTTFCLGSPWTSSVSPWGLFAAHCLDLKYQATLPLGEVSQPVTGVGLYACTACLLLCRQVAFACRESAVPAGIEHAKGLQGATMGWQVTADDAVVTCARLAVTGL